MSDIVYKTAVVHPVFGFEFELSKHPANDVVGGWIFTAGIVPKSSYYWANAQKLWRFHVLYKEDKKALVAAFDKLVTTASLKYPPTLLARLREERQKLSHVQLDLFV